jgi:hypothetical protein
MPAPGVVAKPAEAARALPRPKAAAQKRLTAVRSATSRVTDSMEAMAIRLVAARRLALLDS